ncbi:MAG: hypothetical protein WEB52_14515 [Dehalococcoidia bacterium]
MSKSAIGVVSSALFGIASLFLGLGVDLSPYENTPLALALASFGVFLLLVCSALLIYLWLHRHDDDKVGIETVGFDLEDSIVDGEDTLIEGMDTAFKGKRNRLRLKGTKIKKDSSS